MSEGTLNMTLDPGGGDPRQIAQGSISRVKSHTPSHAGSAITFRVHMVSLKGHSAKLISYHMRSVLGHPHWTNGHVQSPSHL